MSSASVLISRTAPLLCHLGRRSSSVLPSRCAIFRGFSCGSRARAAELYFSKKHEWVKVDNGVGTVGISNYAQEALGDVVYAQLPEPDDDITAGEDCGALESVKAASEIYSPVSGKIVEKNEAVENAPALINSSAMEEGWLFKLTLTKTEELGALMSEESYKEFLKTQEDDH